MVHHSSSWFSFWFMSCQHNSGSHASRKPYLDMSYTRSQLNLKAFAFMPQV